MGFYGGTFDPIHFGHINLALQLSEAGGLDGVLFCPTYCSPFKEPPDTSAGHRLAMLQLAVEDIPHCRVTAYEVHRGEVSYTIDTIRHLQQEQAESVRFRLLLSEDVALHLDRWKEYLELVRLAPPLIGARLPTVKEDLPSYLRSAYTATKVLEISSTEIRARLRKKLYCGHLVPAKVLDYVKANRLYC